jgi:hypothetical protein
MASSLTFYNKFLKYFQDGTIILGTDTIKLMLVTSAYTFDATHDVIADVKTSPDPEVVAIASPSNGYITGGITLTNCAVTFSDSPPLSKFDADDISFATLTATFRRGILYANKTIGSPAIVDPLIASILFDTTPADIVINGIPYVIQWSTNGIYTVG